MRHPLLAATALAATLVATPALAQQTTTTTYPPYPALPGGRPETVAVTITGAPGQRRFDLSTSAPQRDAMPQRRTVTERAFHVATGNPTFDALFALAVDDAHLDSVEQIVDGQFNDGKPIPCHCFATGAKWPYVWTRDLSYALDLGLAGFDPGRGAAALTFKTGDLRPGVARPPELPAGATQIVQDTGSGGSWPVSTDRTAWALGAERTLADLPAPQRAAFAQTALAALTGTLETDRVAAFDPRDGLYGGEHSFLDWREQTYPLWIVDDLAAMAEMKALSTNVLQYRAQRLAARLAREAGDAAKAARYDAWADALAPAIRRAFWDDRAGMFATLLSADPHPARIAKYDLLGNALAIVSGIASPAEARRVLTRYPFAPFGPPVVWPQAPDMLVYHNRAQWPFVTAYALRAAAATGHVAAADRSMDALTRAAALHLSNMENLEWLTGRSHYDDGPQINSARQLWSVGGYLGAVTDTLFGWHPEAEGARIAPFLTTHMRAQLGSTARLSGLPFAGRTVDIALTLPPRAREGGWYPVRSIRLNGRPAPQRITAADLTEGGNLVEVTFGPARRSDTRVTEAPQVPPLSHDDSRAFMPATPAIAVEGRRVTIAGARAGFDYTILRNGVEAGHAADAGWTDLRANAPEAVCYRAIATDPATGLSSHPSAAVCLPGSASQLIAVTDPRIGGSAARVTAADAPALRLALGTTMTVRDVRIARAGTYAVSLDYDNHAFQINTGVTNAVKRLTLTPATGPSRSAVVQMPHGRAIGKTEPNDYDMRPGDTYPLRRSTRAYLRLEPGTYTLTLSDFLNMSALTTNESYINPGGRKGVMNQADVAAVRIDLID